MPSLAIKTAPTSFSKPVAKIEKVVGEILRIIFSSAKNGYAVFSIKGSVPKGQFLLCGTCSDLEKFTEGVVVEGLGNWKIHPKYGHQFAATAITPVMPSDEDGIREFLCSPLVKGIGPKTAELLLEHFGSELRNVLENHPERLKEVKGLAGKRREILINEWNKNNVIKDVMIFLQRYGVTPGKSLKIWEAWGTESMKVLSKNPYRLVELKGFGFHTADAIALKLGHDADSDFRIAAGLLESLKEASENGHCYLPRKTLIKSTETLLKGKSEGQSGLTKKIEAVLDSEIDNEKHRRIVAENDAMYLPTLLKCEKSVATNIRRLLNVARGESPLMNRGDAKDALAAAEWDFHTETGSRLAERQHLAVLNALENPVSVITGGPGMGKTLTIKIILSILGREKNRRIELCAPTGRAAKRMAETTQVPAQTIHRLLGFRGSHFVHDAANPLEVDTLIIDEASMLDVSLASHLFEALPTGCRVILVGDIHQLPSVGAGNVLADLIASERIPVTTLTHVFRQAEESQIVQAAHSILAGQTPLSNLPPKDFFFLPCATNSEVEIEDEGQEFEDNIDAVSSVDTAQTHLTRLLTEELPPLVKDMKRDIQILSPMQRSDTGVRNLNELLQTLLNPPQEEKAELAYGTTIFRRGDKVLQRTNNYEKGVFNGDVGIVETVDLKEKKIAVNFEGNVVQYNRDDLDELVLAYAMTVHKSQGSEYPVVILFLTTQHYMLLDRNLFYTAVTRAKKRIYVIGQEKAIRMAVRQTHSTKRFTGLRNRLRK